MIYTLIILVYIANVFLNRWLNKILYNLEKEGNEPIPIWWLTSLLFTIVTIFEMASIYIKKKLNMKNSISNWFTGKHW